MTDEDALEFLKEHRRILAKEKAGTLINFDISAFDVAIDVLEDRKMIANRHRITDHEFVEKVREIADEYTHNDDYAYKYMENILDLISVYDERKR